MCSSDGRGKELGGLGLGLGLSSQTGKREQAPPHFPPFSVLSDVLVGIMPVQPQQACRYFLISIQWSSIESASLQAEVASLAYMPQFQVGVGVLPCLLRTPPRCQRAHLPNFPPRIMQSHARDSFEGVEVSRISRTAVCLLCPIDSALHIMGRMFPAQRATPSQEKGPFSRCAWACRCSCPRQRASWTALCRRTTRRQPPWRPQPTPRSRSFTPVRCKGPSAHTRGPHLCPFRRVRSPQCFPRAAFSSLPPAGKSDESILFLASHNEGSRLVQLEDGNSVSEALAEQAEASMAAVLSGTEGSEEDDESVLLLAMSQVLQGATLPRLPLSRNCAEAIRRLSTGIVDAFPSFDPRWAEDREHADIAVQEALAQMDSVIIAQQLDGKRQQHMALLTVLSSQPGLWDGISAATRAMILGHAESLSLCMMLRQAQSERDQEGNPRRSVAGLGCWPGLLAWAAGFE